jgi:hypothetical protein
MVTKHSGRWRTNQIVVLGKNVPLHDEATRRKLYYFLYSKILYRAYFLLYNSVYSDIIEINLSFLIWQPAQRPGRLHYVKKNQNLCTIIYIHILSRWVLGKTLHAHKPGPAWTVSCVGTVARLLASGCMQARLKQKAG